MSIEKAGAERQVSGRGWLLWTGAHVKLSPDISLCLLSNQIQDFMAHSLHYVHSNCRFWLTQAAKSISPESNRQMPRRLVLSITQAPHGPTHRSGKNPELEWSWFPQAALRANSKKGSVHRVHGAGLLARSAPFRIFFFFYCLPTESWSLWVRLLSSIK